MSEVDKFLDSYETPKTSGQKPAAPAAKPASEVDSLMEAAPPQDKGFLGYARDLGLSAVKSAIAVPEALVGLADIPTGGRVGKFLENKDGAIGFRPKQAKEFLGEFNTDAYKDQQRQFQEADGILDKTAVAIQNPSLIANTVVESAAPMLAGGVAARGLLAGTRLGQMGAKGAAAAGAIGEGTMMAGSQAEAIRQETEGGLLTPTQAGAAVATGLAGTLFGYLGGRVAQRFGFGDIDTMIARGTNPQGVASEIASLPAKSVPRQVIEGAISEGFLEELPQSISEQIIQNLALNKPWSEGVEDAAVMGTLAGMAMGGGASLYSGMTRPEAPTGEVPPPATGAEPPAATPQGFTPTAERPVIDEAALGRAGVYPPAPAPIINDRALAPAPTPSQQMGLDPAAGPMSAAAALAVDTGASPAAQPATPAGNAGVVWRNGEFDLPVEVLGQAEPDQGGRLFVPVRGTINGRTSTSHVPADQLIGWGGGLGTPAEISPRMGAATGSATQEDQAPAGDDRAMPAPDFGEFAPLTSQQSPVPLENAHRLARMLGANGNAVAVVPNIDATGFGVARVDLLTPEQRAAITLFQPDGLGFPLDQEPIKSESLTPAGATPSTSAVDQESALQPADLESAGARWETMPAEERHALIQRAGLNPVQRRNVQAMPWRKMGDVLRNRLAGVMQPDPSPAVPLGATIQALPANSEAPDAATRWEAMTGEQRQQVAARAGWATKAGAPNVIARRLAQTAWTDLGNSAHDRLAPGLLPDPVDALATPPAAPDMQQDIPTSAATPEAAPAAAPAFAPGQTTKGRDVLLAQVEVLKQRTAPADLVADYNQLKDRIADARRRVSLKATKRAEAETLASWADNQDRELERLRAQIGFVEMKAGTARYKVLNTPENLEAFAQKLKKAPVGRWTVTVQPDEVYDNLETRPGTTEAQRGTGRSALRDLLGRLGNSLARRRNDGADRGAVSLLGARLYDGFVAGEANQLLGQAVSSPADLATLAQVYRDPRFETFRAFFVKNGRIIGENGYSSRLPAVVRVPDNLPEQIRDDMQAFGADGYYLLHNHPSGRAEPSVQDVRLTNDVDQKAPGMLGHIVIDHNEYSVIQGSGQVQRVAAPELAAVDFKSKPTLAHNLLNVEVGGPVDVASIAKALQIPGGHATLVLTGSDGRVSLLLDLPAAMLDDASPEALGKVKGVMRALARESGSGGHRFLVLPAGAQTNFAMGELIRLGVVSDVVTAAGDSMRMNGTPWGGNFLDGRDAKAMRISDEASPYTVAEDAPPRYARDTADAPQGQADPGALPPAPRLTPAEWIGHALRTNRGWAMGALTRDQITDIWGESMPGVRRFDEVVREMDTVRQRIAERADVILERWRELPSEVADRVSDLMHRATLAQFDPETHRTGALRTEQADMLRMWKTLPPAAQSLYRDVRDTYRETLLSIRDGLASRAENAGTNGARIAAQIRLEFDNYLKDGPYFPLARFGELVLIADKGKERIVETFESSAQRELRMRQLRGAGWTVKATSKAEYSATRDGAAGQFIGDVLEKVNALEMPADQKSALMDNLNQLAIGTLPDASYRRHFRHRKGVPGFSSDAMRAFAASMQHAGHHIAKIRHAQELALLLDEMQKDARDARGDVDVTEQQQVINELSRRLDYLMNPSTHPVAAAAGQVGFVMSLGGSVASGLVNLTQTPFVTLPWLGARYGFGKASTALTLAARDYFGGKWEKWSGFVMAGNPKLNGDEQRAIRELETMGLINLTQAHDLAGTANTDSTVSRRAFVIDRAMKIVGWTFHVPEVFNRQVSALAAYRLARDKGQDHAGAVEAARGALIRTHFDYSASNRARFMHGNFTRVITMFKQYSQQMTYLLWRNAYQALKGESPEVKREARRMLVGVAAMHFTAAGSLGLPLGVFGITPLLGLLSMGMGDEDDPWDWEAEYRNMLADVFGKEGGEAIAHGPMRMLLNVDLASRVGLGDLWIRGPQKEAEGRDLVEAWLISLLGPVAGYAGQMGTAAKAFEEGKFARGVESMMPKFISAPLRAYRYNDEGVRSWRGDDLGIDLKPADIVGTALGFQPARLAEMYEGRNAVKGREARLQDRRSEILNMWVAASMAGDQGGMLEAADDARRFSNRNPEFAINALSFQRAYRAKVRNAGQIRDGIHLSRKRDALREEGRFANVD